MRHDASGQVVKEESEMRCPRCSSEHTSLSWLREHTIIYWCTPCHAAFEVDRTLVQSTARPVETRSARAGARENGATEGAGQIA